MTTKTLNPTRPTNTQRRLDTLDPRDRTMFENDFDPIAVQCFTNPAKHHVFKREDGIRYYTQTYQRTPEACDEFENRMKELEKWTPRHAEFNVPHSEIKTRLDDREDGRGLSFWEACTYTNSNGELVEDHGWLDSWLRGINESVADRRGSRVDFTIEDLDRESVHNLIRRRKKLERRGFGGLGFACGVSAVSYWSDSVGDHTKYYFSGMPSLRLIREIAEEAEALGDVEEIFLEGQIYVAADWTDNPVEARANAEPTCHYWQISIALRAKK